MRPAAPGANVPAVNQASPIVLLLELEPGAEPIAGVLCGPAGQRLAFAGWLGLASALGRLTTPPNDADPPEVSTPC